MYIDNIVQAIIVCGYYDNPTLYVRFMYMYCIHSPQLH